MLEITESHPPKQRNERISRLLRRYQNGDLFISIERAKYYTDHWLSTEDSDMPRQIRVSQAMKNVYEKMTHYVDPDDRIAGYWTEDFLGLPINIEKGEYNKVFESELKKSDMIFFRTGSLMKGLYYMTRKGALGDFLRNQKIMRESGVQPLNMSFETMSDRSINPFQIRKRDKTYLLKELLPKWKGRSLVDFLEKELIQSGLYSSDMHDFVTAIPGNTSRQVLMLSTCATIASIQGHVILDYERVLREGLENMLAEVREALEDKALRDNERTFLHSIEIALEGVSIYAKRLAERIAQKLWMERDPEQRAVYEDLLDNCQAVPLKPASSFREAVQSLWTVKTAVELAHPINLHCFGRLDQILYPYYCKDTDENKIKRDEALELLEELLLKVMSQNIRPESNILANFYHRYLGSTPITVGGVKPDGNDGTNDLTYLFIEAAHNCKAVTNMSVRIHPETPDDVLQKMAEYLYEGTSSYSLYNDDVIIEAMERKGYSTADARDYALMGCVEATCPGKTGSMSANALLLTRLLDITLRNGDSCTLAGTIRNEGLKTGDPDLFSSFDDLLAAFYQQAGYFIEKIVKASNLRDRIHAEILPAPYISAFMDGCLESRKDVTMGGSRYDLSGISMINSIANLIDSLYVIKKLVFEKRKYTIKVILDAMDSNFINNKRLYNDIQKLQGKWGNGNAEVDQLAREVMGVLFKKSYKYRNYKGGPFVIYIISMITHTIDGRLSIATPDGRKASTPFAASCNPYNVEKEGLTAVLRSVSSLPFEDVLGCAVNIKFHPNAIGATPEIKKKWISLIRTYFKIGGAQLQPTVASAETLRAAQENPEQFKDLIVKVGGYSTYFVELGREIQNEVIARTEHRE